MEWKQVLTIVATTSSIMGGGIVTLWNITKEIVEKMETYHKEDIQHYRDDIRINDEKWEKLFDRLMEKK